MSHKHLAQAIALLAPAILTGCVDSSYDLNDIKDVRVEVKDLTLPANLEPITMDNVIKFDENSKIKSVTINSKTFYALCQSGHFDTDPIELPSVLVPATDIPDTEADMPRISAPAGTSRRAPGQTVSYLLEDITGVFDYSSDDPLPKELTKIVDITVTPFSFELDLTVDDPSNLFDELSFNDVDIQIPAGLTVYPFQGGSYNKQTGIWHVDGITLPKGEKKVALSLTARAIDIAAAKVEITPDNKFFLHGDFTIKRGIVNAEPSIVAGVPTAMPETAKVKIQYNLESFDIQAFSGSIRYVDGISIDPVVLSDIPDFLQGDETVIKLANPQIYLQLNNPVAADGVTLRGNLDLQAIRGDHSTRTFRLDNNQEIEVGTVYGVDGPYSFALAPSQDDLNVPTPGSPEGNDVDYSRDLTYYPFTSLRNLLVPGNGESGLPDKIGIDMNVPETDVIDFPLDRTLVGFSGDYELVAPLALNDGSRIIYEEDVTGWGENDLADLTVTKLRVTATATNNTPVAISLSVQPLQPGDPNPTVIPGAELTSNVIAAGSTSELVIEFVNPDVEVSNLDGIRLHAILDGSTLTNPLSPDQTLVLENLKATVSGYYNAKLD